MLGLGVVHVCVRENKREREKDRDHSGIWVGKVVGKIREFREKIDYMLR